MKRTSLVVFSFLMIAGLLAACGSNLVYGDQAVLVGTVTLDCSKNCRDYGSCGPSQETGKNVILLGVEPAFPGVSSVAFEGLVAGTQVEILDTQVVEGVEQRSNEQLQIRFYAVKEADGVTAGWVPGFCIASSGE